MICGYARVSTRIQEREGNSLEAQEQQLKAAGAKVGISFIDELLSHGINVNVLNMGLMDNSPTGKLIRSILLAFAEFERDMIVERTQEGRRLSGHYGGRPRKYKKEQLEHAMLLLENHSYNQVSGMTGISVSTLYRTKLREKVENGNLHT